MATETITEDGLVLYRTRLIRDEDLAQRFARCLVANGRFDAVEVIQSERAKGEAWYVTFRPTGASAVEALRERQANTRTRRARQEAPLYGFERDGLDHAWLLSPSGHLYEVTPVACSCADFTYRCKAAGLLCKHIQAFRIWQSGGPSPERACP